MAYFVCHRRPCIFPHVNTHTHTTVRLIGFCLYSLAFSPIISNHILNAHTR